MIHYFQVYYEKVGDLMEFQEMKEYLLEQVLNKQLVTATISQPRTKSNEVKRVKLKPIEIKNTYHIQLEYKYERILKHENIALEAFTEKLDDLLEQFRQLHIDFKAEKVQAQLSKKNKVMWKSEKVTTAKTVDLSHNRKKNYLLDEHTPYPFLIRLGVQTPDGKVKKQKYD